MREFLSDHQVSFEDRNIRGDTSARAELAGLSSEMLVPQLFWGNVHIIGFDPQKLDDFVVAYRSASS